MKKAALLACSILPAASGPAPSLARFDGTWLTEAETAQLPQRPEVFVIQNGLYSCESCVPPFSIRADGVSHQVLGNPYFDAAAMKVINPNTFQVDHLKSGRVISSGVLKVGPDGQTLRDDFSHSSSIHPEPVTGHLTAKRVGNGPSGSASLSGAWKMTSLLEADVDKTFTFKTAGEILQMSRPSGQSYSANQSGTEAVYLGDPGITNVQVRILDSNVIEETDLRNGVVIGVITMTLSADGRMLRSVRIDKLRGFKNASNAYRQ